MDESINELLQQFARLEVEQTELQQRSEAVKKKQQRIKEIINSRTTHSGRQAKPTTREAGPPDIGTTVTDRNGRTLRIGQLVYCVTPRRYKERYGTVTKIHPSRVTILLRDPKGNTTFREHNNVKIIEEPPTS